MLLENVSYEIEGDNCVVEFNYIENGFNVDCVYRFLVRHNVANDFKKQLQRIEQMHISVKERSQLHDKLLEFLKARAIKTYLLGDVDAISSCY